MSLDSPPAKVRSQCIEHAGSDPHPTTRTKEPTHLPLHIHGVSIFLWQTASLKECQHSSSYLGIICQPKTGNLWSRLWGSTILEFSSSKYCQKSEKPSAKAANSTTVGRPTWSWLEKSYKGVIMSAFFSKWLLAQSKEGHLAVNPSLCLLLARSGIIILLRF